MYNLFIKKKLFAKYPYLPKSVLYNILTLPEGMTSGSGSYERNSFVTVSTIVPNGYKFTGWTENNNIVSTKLNYTFIINSDRELVANFEENTHTITTSVNPTEGGSTTGSGTYTYGYSVTVNATPKTGYRFVDWTENGIVVSTNAEYSFIITKDRNLVANFEKEIVLYTLTVNCDEGGIVTANNINISNSSRSYNEGTTIILKASSNSGYKFTGWLLMGPSGSYLAISGTTGNIILIDNIDRDYTFKAAFENQIDDLSKDYLIFLALEDDCEISFDLGSAGTSINLQYSIDEGNTWESMPNKGVTIDANEYILLKKGIDIYQTRAAQQGKIGTFVVTKNFKALGNLYSLITDDFDENTVINEDTPTEIFKDLFANCTTLQSVPKNFLFAKRIVSGIYESMFSGCTSLTDAPDLPATLSATNELGDCYLGMFNGCTNLSTGPTISLNLYELSIYASYTFASMFNGCTNLKSIKFNGGGSLQNNDIGFGTADGLFSNWVNGVTAAGKLTVTNNSYYNIFKDYKNVHGIPLNWTIEYKTEVVVTPGTGTDK